MDRHAPDAEIEWALGLQNEIDRTQGERGPRAFAITFFLGGIAAASLGGWDAWWFTGLAWIVAGACLRLEARRRRRLAWLRERASAHALLRRRP